MWYIINIVINLIDRCNNRKDIMLNHVLGSSGLLYRVIFCWLSKVGISGDLKLSNRTS